MKKIVSSILFAALLLPATTHALSCMDPATMADNYIESSDYVIFTGIAGETREHIKQAAETGDLINPNMRFNEGYTGQFVEVTELHKGQVSGDLWVYHAQNSTWGYMCSHGPAKDGAEALFVVTPPSGSFDFPRVVDAYPIDSELAQGLITRLAAAEDNGPAYVNFTTSENWSSNLRTQIKEMIFIIRLKVSEWRWWRENSAG